jgi:L-rhamnose-H+ transport protein
MSLTLVGDILIFPPSQGLPVLCVVLVGGFTTKFCLVSLSSFHLFKNRTSLELLGVRGAATAGGNAPATLARNYLLCALAGTAWYFQCFFYTMGESQMGAYAFSSWTLHMASIIIFGTLWGFSLREWAQSKRRTKRTVWLGGNHV